MRFTVILLLAAALAAAAPRDDSRAAAKIVRQKLAVPTALRLADGCAIEEITPGATIDGALTLTDCSQRQFLAQGGVIRADGYKLAIRENLVVQMEMKSPDFEPDILLLDESGELIAYDETTSESDKTAVVLIHLAPGNYTILATGYSTAAGAYRIAIQGEAPRTCLLQPINAGEEINASFENSDCRYLDLVPFETSSTPIDAFSVSVRNKQALTVGFASTEIAAEMILTDSEGVTLASSSDSGLETAAISSVLPGAYQIFVIAADSKAGAYKLKTSLEDLRPCSSDAISTGQTANGELTSADCRDLDIFVPGEYTSPTDPWKFEITEPAIVTLTMRSNAFDTFLTLTGDRNEVLAANDDFERLTADSQVRISLNPGVYSALASNYEGLGAYTLSLESEAPRLCDVPELGSIAATGTLGPNDCRVQDLILPSADRNFVDAFSVKVSARMKYSFEATSRVFTPALRLYTKDRELIFSTPSTSSAKFEVLLVPGEYLLLVVSRDQPGEYRVTATAQEPKQCEVSPIAADSRVEGILQTSDCAMYDAVPNLASSLRVDQYRLELADKRTVSFKAESRAFPPVILISDQNDKFVQVAINEDLRTSVQTSATLAAGTYQVVVTSFLNLQGDYSLTTGSSAPAEQVTKRRQASAAVRSHRNGSACTDCSVRVRKR